MKRMKIIALLLVVFLMLSACAVNNGEAAAPDNVDASNDSGNLGINIWDTPDQGSQNKVFAMYDKSYETVEELMEDTVLIVRATPVAKESESPVGVCWVLRVAEASQDGVSEIRLRQLKDEYLLKMNEETVIALKGDMDSGYYYVPGGGYGLFRINDETGKVKDAAGELLKELVGDRENVTLEDVYDLLLERN